MDLNSVLIALASAGIGWALRHFKILGGSATPAPVGPSPVLPPSLSHDQILAFIWAKVQTVLAQAIQDAINQALKQAPALPAAPASPAPKP